METSAAKKVRQYGQNGWSGSRISEHEREYYITEYAPLIKVVAGRLAMRLPSHIDQNDLLSAGIMGLLDAIQKFDPEKGVAFKSYAEFRIRGAMLDELRAMDWVPRSVRKNAKLLEKAYGNVERRTMKPATDEEVAKELGVDMDSFHRLIDETRGISVFNEEDLGELLAHKKISDSFHTTGGSIMIDPVESLDLREMKEVLAKAIDALPKKERTVITLYYYEELTMKEIGDVIGYTESRISQLHTKAVIRLRHRIRRYFEQ
jgi:RNA polymerase sigma factor for flagellar operon FliA